ncbi:hypothetical protein Bca52824_008943 [Brassica carinata]|uniref:3-phosphoshikimate 1-carboxyvinyltransferase n=1 Tax=Brassica carinata TaxID=52824 RepID=A0A8X8B8M4_BRACI|nr:hypothetical protein Bca52824_008943 [Brassica carinata]
MFLYVLDGVPRMRERPIGDLVVGLKQLGADVECTLGTNCPPVRVNANGGLPGGKVKLSGSISNGPTTIRDVASWRVKETERMIAICTELRKLGAIVEEEGSDYCVITPPAKLKPAEIDTYDDHRMAMAFSLAACADVPVTIKDPGCTRKTFPDY